MSVEYNLEGDSSSLVSSLEQAIRELTEATKAATETTAAVKQLTAEQKAAADATKQSTDAAKANADAHNGLIKVVRAFGGEVSTNVRHLDLLTRGLGQASSGLTDMGAAAAGVGVGAAAVGLAVVGLADGLVDLANAAAGAKDRLEKMGIIVDEASAHELDAYAAGAQKLSVAFDQLEVASGSKIAEDIGAIETALAAVVHQIEPTNLGLGELIGRLANLGPLAFLVQKAFDSLFGDEETINRHLALQKKMHDEYVADLNDMAHASKESTDRMLSDLRLQEAEDKKIIETTDQVAVAKAKAAAAAEKAAEQEYLSELRWGQTFYNSLLEMVKKQEQAEQKLRDAEDQWTKERADEATFDAHQAEQQIGDELKTWEDARKKEQELLKGIAEESGQFIETTFQAVSDATAQSYQDQLSKIDASISKQQDLVNKLQSSNDAADKARLKSQIDALNGLEAEKRRIAYDSFKSEQESAIGQALLQGAVAVVTALAQLGPIAGAIAAGFIGATTATQVGIIEAQSPPPAHDGGVLGADELNIGNRRVRQGEAAVIFNQRAVQSGALDQAQRINRDQASGTGQREVRLVMADAGRVVGELVARETRRPGSPLAAAFGRTGVVDPYARSR